MKKKFWFSLASLALVGLLFTGNHSAIDASAKKQVVKIGVVGADTDVWDGVKKRIDAAGEKFTLKFVKFSDYNQPNQALAEGSIDLNSFQHQFFLDNFNKEHGTDLVSIGNTSVAPLGIYSKKIKNVKELKDGASVSIPNDVTNGGRALLLLQTAGLLTIDKKAGLTPTVKDITDNKKHLKIKELDASQTARSLEDVDIALINSGVAVDSGLTPTKDAIFLEPVNDKSKPYVNIIVARKKDAKNKIYNKIVDYYQTKETATDITKTSKGSSIPSWEKYGRK
ncbi:MetQ/NlpA family ABC transporter substrate-binding protein [Atopobacter sp. AH10]|uniref:MetQ/NlpA family ABC transporter substrate-binding protein n=1 Tax=Atopobacter sp. AH10 TaxID=2315861 RepID=UPI000EF184F9|nr:MetQ/NlpA family ABC transporter substrate-binding protein [Atopobacter sp. AH10]RLK62637.1 MetQ/NlpA family ABC transporter substrate-binding protein [Atopobacter sp. AH10]